MKSKKRLHNLVKPAGAATNAVKFTEEQLEPKLIKLLSEIAELESISLDEALARVAVSALKSNA